MLEDPEFGAWLEMCARMGRLERELDEVNHNLECLTKTMAQWAEVEGRLQERTETHVAVQHEWLKKEVDRIAEDNSLWRRETVKLEPRYAE